jgi:hypothetical protein
MSPNFRAHPEFGYFCLSQSFRRKARNALLSTVAAGVVATGFMLWSRDDPHEGALAIASVNEAPASAATMSTVVRAASATTAEGLDPPASSKATCEGDNWTQVDGKCVVRRAHKPGSLASATEGPQIAVVPANPNTPPLPVAALPAPKRENAAVAAKETEPPSAAQSPPAQKAGRRTPRSQTAGRGPDRASAGSRDARSREDQRNARTYASSEDSPRQMPGPKSAMKWARQLQDCIGAVRCRAGEQLMRAFLSGGI